MKKKLPLFSAYGVELEYMIVDKDQLSIMPISDRLIYDVAGEYKNEVAFEHIAWSNELVLHVIELKTNGPAKALTSLSNHFQHQIQKINQSLHKYNARLMPTGAHPWMDPYSEAKLWPHDCNIIYETYDRIFNCKGHGWSNLQSVHLNLPFANDEEFSKLHTAIRQLLPIIPALSASTPIVDHKITGLLDTRLEFYRLNQQKFPSVTGRVIPELVFSEKEYNEKILQPMYQEIAPADPDKVLQEEWLNSRGAITLFNRNTIEIRIVDIQECPAADLAILDIIVAVLKQIIAERWTTFSDQTKWSDERLQTIFLDSIKHGTKTIISDKNYATLFGLSPEKISVNELWQHLVEQVTSQCQEIDSITVINNILAQGNLAERILKVANNHLSDQRLQTIYRDLSDCLQHGKMFLPC